MKSRRGFPYNLPVGSGLLLLGVGLFLTVTGVLVPSFVVYWNFGPTPTGSHGSYGSMGPAGSDVMEILGSGSPMTYNVTVSTSGPVHVELISFDKYIPSQDWGTGTHFSRILVVTEYVQVKVSNPSSTDLIDFGIWAQEVRSVRYPSEYLSSYLPYIAALILVGVVSLGIGAVLLRRDAIAFLGSVHEKGFWTCFLMPAMIAMDALITYISIQLYGLAAESNSIVVSLYLTGLWAVLIFHFAAIFLVTGFSFLLYRFMVKSGLPRMSKLAIAVVFSVVSAIIGDLVLWTSGGLLSRMFETPVFGVLLFTSIFWVPALFSSILSAYLSTVIPQSEEHSAS